jgi:DNA-binding response OmpR family regulator
MASKRILVVDDDAAILRLVATILRRERFEVDTASGGRAALSMIAHLQYDVIVLDLMMPDISGFEVLRSLYASVPENRCVVVMSAAPPFDVARAINPTVFVTLSKPFDYPKLVGSVRACIESHEPGMLPIPPAVAAA